MTPPTDTPCSDPALDDPYCEVCCLILRDLAICIHCRDAFCKNHWNDHECEPGQ